MRQISVLLLGFGNVGQAFATMVLQKREELAAAGLEIIVKGISTGSHGTTLQTAAAGVDLAACLQLCSEGEGWRLPEGSTPVASTEAMLDAAAALKLELDAVLEGVPANFETGEPALSYLRRAITELDCHAITASKGPVLHGVKELEVAAEAAGKRFLFESSVMDGQSVTATNPAPATFN
jgi:homoserine dehydrogenase